MGIRFYIPEEIFLNAKNVEYPSPESFQKRYPGVISTLIFNLCKSSMLKNKKTNSNSKKSNTKRQRMLQTCKTEKKAKCEFLNQKFPGNTRNKTPIFNIKDYFKCTEYFSEFIDGHYNYYSKARSTFFDLKHLNEEISFSEEKGSGVLELKEELNSKNEKIMVLLFGSPGSGKSVICRKYLSKLTRISNVNSIFCILILLILCVYNS